MATTTGRVKLIVGIDYGTTYSGLSFALSTARDFRDIFPWTKYPGASTHSAEHCVKTPTRIAFASENEDLDSDAWGYEVEPGMKVYALTKLLLDKSAALSDFDDPDVYGDSTGEMMKLPEGKSAKEVASAYLKQMYKMFDAARSEKFGAMNLDELTVDFWLTVPASWSEQAKILTKTAARNAGFGVRPIDRLLLISEPEAAAQYTLKSGLDRLESFVRPDTGVMVCDCGGGTVDITTYEIEETEPTLKLREIAVGVAGKCGGSYVDRNLFKLLTHRFGDAFTTLPADQIGPGSSFMDQFELKKKDFSGKNPSRRAHRLPLHMPALKHTDAMEKFYETRSSSILLTHDDFKILFDPVVCKVLELINDQVSGAKAKGERAIETLVLVGGFAASPYLLEAVLQWCKARGLRLTTPISGAWSAVVCGAVLRGLEGCIVREKKCRRHYGYDVAYRYDPLKHSGYDRSKRSVYMDVFGGFKRLDGFMEWDMRKGSKIDRDTEIESTVSWTFRGMKSHQASLTLYSCSLDEAPDTIESPRIELVGNVSFTVGAEQLATAQRVSIDDQFHYRVFTVVHTRLNDDSGHLVFRVLVDGEELGRAAIDLDD